MFFYFVVMFFLLKRVISSNNGYHCVTKETLSEEALRYFSKKNFYRIMGGGKRVEDILISENF